MPLADLDVEGHWPRRYRVSRPRRGGDWHDPRHATRNSPTRSSSTTTACCSTPSRSGPGPRRTSSSAAALEFTPADKRELVGTSAAIAGGVLERRLGEPGRAGELIEELNVLVVAELEHGVEAMLGARDLLERAEAARHPDRPRLQLADRLRPPLAGDRRLRGPLRRRRSAPTKSRRRSRRPIPTWRPAAASGSSRARRRRARGLADRRRRRARRGPDRDRCALDRGRRARGSARHRRRRCVDAARRRAVSILSG